MKEERMYKKLAIIGVFLGLLFFLIEAAPISASESSSYEIRDEETSEGWEYSESQDFGLYSTLGQTSSGYSEGSNNGMRAGVEYYYGNIVGGSVLDTDGVDGSSDIDTTDNKENLYASWSGFRAIDTVISQYQVAVGSGIGSNDERTVFLNWTSIGNVNTYQIPMQLEFDTVYYVSVRGVGFDGTLSAPVASDGVSLNDKLKDISFSLDNLIINGTDIDVEHPIVIEADDDKLTVEGTIGNAGSDDKFYIYIYDNEGTLVWSSLINLDEDGHFVFFGNTGLPDGEYVLQIIGITDDGRQATLFSTDYILGLLPETGDEKPKGFLGMIKDFFSKAVDSILEYIKEPGNIGQAATIANVALQAFSILTLINAVKDNLTNVFGILSQLIFGKAPLKDLWGIVFNSRNGKPIPYAVVRVLDSKSNSVVATTVTDLNGRYGFPVGPGTYNIEVEHDEYNFPSKALSSKLLKTNDMYIGGEFTLTQTTSIDFNIPLDPKELKAGISYIHVKVFVSKIRELTLTGNYIYIGALFVLNLSLMLFAFNYVNLSFTILNGLFLFTKLLSDFIKPKAYGVVYNSQSGRPVAPAFVKIYNGGTKELLDTNITDKEGNYQFFVPDGKYLVLVSAQGYKFPSEVQPKGTLGYHEGLVMLDASNGVINTDLPVDERPQEATYFI